MPICKWAQDIGEVVATPHGSELLIPPYHISNEEKHVTDGLVSALQLHGFRARQAGVYFEGGNVTCDRFNGGSILFVGEGDFVTARAHGERMSEDAWAKRLQREFNVGQVEVMARGQSHTPVYHLDLAFSIIRPGEVVVMDLEGLTERDVKRITGELGSRARLLGKRLRGLRHDDPARRSVADEYWFLVDRALASDRGALQQTHGILRQIQEHFASLGYTVHRFPADPLQMLCYQSYANTVPFASRETGAPSIIVPVFPAIDGRYEEGLAQNEKALQFYRKLGLCVIPARSGTAHLMGSVGCLVKPIR